MKIVYKLLVRTASSTKRERRGRSKLLLVQ